MIALKQFADVGIRHFGNFANKINGDVADLCDLLGSLFANDLLLRDIKFFINGGKDLINGHVQGLGIAKQVTDTVWR